MSCVHDMLQYIFTLACNYIELHIFFDYTKGFWIFFTYYVFSYLFWMMSVDGTYLTE